MTIFIIPGDPLAKDDQTLVKCVEKALTERPSALTIASTSESADVKLTVHNATKARIHVVGTLTKPDGTTLIEVNHVTHGFNHTLCNQADGLLDEMARKGTEAAPLLLKALER